jgi:hypothetical protein
MYKSSRGPCLKLLLTILRFSLPHYPYQKDERAKPRNLLTKLCFFSIHSKVSLTFPKTFHFHLLLYYTFLPTACLFTRKAKITFPVPCCISPEGVAKVVGALGDNWREQKKDNWRSQIGCALRKPLQLVCLPNWPGSVESQGCRPPPSVRNYQHATKLKFLK